jgi:hypothetical protein
MNNRMKNIMKIVMLAGGAIVAAIAVAEAQTKIDNTRMDRDIEVAENVLGTLIRQDFGKHNFFPTQVQGSYLEGYGVTFRLPMDFGGPMMVVLDKVDMGQGYGYGSNYTYSYSSKSSDEREGDCENCPVKAKTKVAIAPTPPPSGSGQNSRSRRNRDSLRTAYTQKIITASKDFLADYGDLIGQLAPTDKITITNRMEGNRNLFWKSEGGGRSYLSVQAAKSDITQYKQGKLTRDQFMATVKVVNSESSDEVSPDLELLTSIFNRLYRSDLSKTYFVEDNIFYERLKDYGVLYYMNVYSSTDGEYSRWNMPTVGLTDIDQAERDKKVKALYPDFEKSIREDIVEYGKTLKSLKDDEALVFNIKLTKCKDCGIPATLEISVKSAVLKDYSSGKLTKDAAVAQETLKKGPNQ